VDGPVEPSPPDLIIGLCNIPRFADGFLLVILPVPSEGCVAMACTSVARAIRESSCLRPGARPPTGFGDRTSGLVRPDCCAHRFKGCSQGFLNINTVIPIRLTVMLCNNLNTSGIIEDNLMKVNEFFP
jgi:hypothetical protein